MSSFFRSAADISSSRDDDTATSQDDTTDHSDSEHRIARIRTLGSSNAGDQSESGAHEAFTDRSRRSSYHRDLLLHALLEERCINEAFDDLNAAGSRVDNKSHPEVRALAKEKYSNLSQKLGSYGLVTGDLDSDQLGALRQTYRDGLSLLTRTSATVQPPLEDSLDQSTVPGPLLRLLNGGSSTTGDMNRRFSGMALTGSNVVQPNLLGGILPGHPLLQSTRYSRDFEEFGILGKGGYGTVFRAKHNLDGRHYAVKKIPLGPSRMRRIQEQGQAELDNILVEVRTLARLEHPNIVRYHSGWIEWAPLMVSAKQAGQINGRKLLEAPRRVSGCELSDDDEPTSAGAPAIDVQFGYDDEDDIGMSFGQSPGQRFATQDEEHILFEESSRKTANTVSDTHSLEPGSYTEGAPLQKIPSRGTVASVSDESEIEVITRKDDPTTSFDSSSFTGSQSHRSEPSLALHIQMSLYSMTLSDFLAPSSGTPDSAAIASLRHCFHPHSSLEILSSIIEGVEYLHSEGIVHRDLKPGNIFLGVRPGSKCPPGAIALSSCSKCRDLGMTRPFNVSICIGDFGLVSAIAQPEDIPNSGSASCKAVGTEIYRPETVTRDNHPSLDVFALGIITFELFCKFGTRMERHETLHKLKKAQLPDGFEKSVECEGLQEWIESMVSACEVKCPTWDELRASLNEMLQKCAQNLSNSLLSRP